MKNVLRRLALVCLALCALGAFAAEPRRNVGIAAEKRVALVIGNGKYAGSPLKNPANDARDMAAALRKIGFDVIEKTDVTQKEMNRAITQFGAKLTSDAIALFFYAGHGMQVKGKNYLIPVDAQIENEASVRAETVDVDTVLDQLAASPLNVVILDACRNNPFERRFRGTGGGLAQMDAPKGTLIAYATSPGKVASDGEGRNGLYTQELLKVLQTPGLEVEKAFKRVRAGVARATGDNQIPWEASSLTGDFFFSRGEAAATVNAQPVLADPEEEAWVAAERVGTASGYQAYLDAWPKGRYAVAARIGLDASRDSAPASSSRVQDAAGHACDQDGQCGSGLYCIGGTCRDQMGRGEQCMRNTDCAGTLLCNQGRCDVPTRQASTGQTTESVAIPIWTRLVSTNTFGAAIARCFHPTASYSHANFQAIPRIRADARQMSGEGQVLFFGGVTRSRYEMRFTMELRLDGETGAGLRITPTSDNAPFPPNATCALRNWQRL